MEGYGRALRYESQFQLVVPLPIIAYEDVRFKCCRGRCLFSKDIPHRNRDTRPVYLSAITETCDTVGSLLEHVDVVHNLAEFWCADTFQLVPYDDVALLPIAKPPISLKHQLSDGNRGYAILGGPAKYDRRLHHEDKRVRKRMAE